MKAKALMCAHALVVTWLLASAVPASGESETQDPNETHWVHTVQGSLQRPEMGASPLTLLAVAIAIVSGIGWVHGFTRRAKRNRQLLNEQNLLWLHQRKS